MKFELFNNEDTETWGDENGHLALMQRPVFNVPC